MQAFKWSVLTHVKKMSLTPCSMRLIEWSFLQIGFSSCKKYGFPVQHGSHRAVILTTVVAKQKVRLVPPYPWISPQSSWNFLCATMIEALKAKRMYSLCFPFVLFAFSLSCHSPFIFDCPLSLSLPYPLPFPLRKVTMPKPWYKRTLSAEEAIGKLRDLRRNSGKTIWKLTYERKD